MIITDKNSMASRFIWLTQYSPSGAEITLTEPKLIPVGNNQYAVLFSEETSNQSVLHYLLMDISGNVILSKLYKNVTIQTDSQPILWGRNIVWVSGNYDNGSYDSSRTYLYEIPVVTTPLNGIALNQTNLTIDEGNTQKLTPSFTPSNSDDVKMWSDKQQSWDCVCLRGWNHSGERLWSGSNHCFCRRFSDPVSGDGKGI